LNRAEGGVEQVAVVSEFRAVVDLHARGGD